MSRSELTLQVNWHTVRFGDVVRNVDQAVRDPLTCDLERFVGLEHIDPESLRIKRWGLIADGTSFTRKFTAAQVLFGKRRAYQRKVAVADFDGLCSSDILAFEPADDRLLPELLPFIVQTEGFFQHALGTSAGSLSPRTRWRDLAAYEFPLPPLDEQRRIAEVLWAAEEMRDKYGDLLQATKAFRQALLDQIIPDPANQTAGEGVTRLEAVCSLQNGRGFPSEDYQSTGVKLLRPGNLGKNGYFSWTEEATRCLPEGYRESASTFMVSPGDVVINLTAQSLEDGFMGRVCLAQDGDVSLLNQRIGRFACHDGLLPEYLYRYLQTTRFRQVVESNCEGSKVKHLYWRHISNFPLVVPSLAEQEKVIRVLRMAVEATNRAELSMATSLRLAASVREQLIH